MSKEFNEIMAERREARSLKLRPSVMAACRRVAKRKNYFMSAYVETLMIKDAQAEGELPAALPLPRQRKSKPASK